MKKKRNDRLLAVIAALITAIILIVMLCSKFHVEHETTVKAEEPKQTETESIPEPEPVAEKITVTAYAYCPCSKCCGVWAENRPIDENGKPIILTASGARATEGRTIAVDPTVIPYGTEVIFDGKTYIAEDCGGGIKGNTIDVYFDTHEKALEFGVQQKEVTIRKGASHGKCC